MEITQAIEVMARILNEERQRPTIRYEDNLSDVTNSAAGTNPLLIMAKAVSNVPQFARANLVEARKVRPRLVRENPEIFTFKGTNYDLVLRLFSQVNERNRHDFIDAMLKFVEAGGYVSRQGRVYHYPTISGVVSDMPLIAEFCARTGHIKELLEAAATVKQPSNGLALMLMQFEETIALNFNIFTQDELKQIPHWLDSIRKMADLQTHSARGPRGGKLVENPHYRPGREGEANQIVESIDGIAAECNQAIYFYLKGALQQTRNPEVEGDKVELVNFLDTLGFKSELKESLEEAEKQYRDDSSPFELKNCFAHLRSFLEVMHREAAKSLAASAGETITDRWGAAILYLRQKGVITQQHESFVSSLYTLISDTSVHPLTADREYARLLRNVVIEYGVMYLSALERKGVKIS